MSSTARWSITTWGTVKSQSSSTRWRRLPSGVPSIRLTKPVLAVLAARPRSRRQRTAKQNANETPSKPEEEAQANPEANANETPSKTRTDCERNANETRTKEKEKEGKEELPNGSSKKAAHRAAFRPPSVEEVVAYATEANLALDANRFCDYYASKGWLVGKARMKDWKAAARNWAARDRGGVKPNAELGEYAQPF